MTDPFEYFNLPGAAVEPDAVTYEHRAFHFIFQRFFRIAEVGSDKLLDRSFTPGILRKVEKIIDNMAANMEQEPVTIH